MTNKSVERLNELFARELGRSPLGQPLFAWVFLPTLFHWRYRQGKDDYRPHKVGSGGNGQDSTSNPVLWVPSPTFEQVRSYPWLGERWCVAKWYGLTDDEWRRAFGSRTHRPPQGYYFPTDTLMKPGIKPTMELTEYFIRCIKETRSKSAQEYEQRVEADMEREDRATFNSLLDIIEDACTAFGNIPGSRGGGVSFPDVKTTKRSNVTLCQR